MLKIMNGLISAAAILLGLCKIYLPCSLKLIVISQMISLAKFIPSPNQYRIKDYIELCRYDILSKAAPNIVGNLFASREKS